MAILNYQRSKDNERILTCIHCCTNNYANYNSFCTAYSHGSRKVLGMIYFIADTHFGHRNICKFRTEFSCPEEHDETIIANWNSIIKKKKQIVWCLGDTCMENKEYDFTELLGRLNGEIRLIRGNHDWLPTWYHSHIYPPLHSKYKCWLSHAPIHPQELRGKINIHGHVHQQSIPDKRYCNVSAEVINYTPKALDDIRKEYE